jgi:hypothetical protein
MLKSEISCVSVAEELPWKFELEEANVATTVWLPALRELVERHGSGRGRSGGRLNRSRKCDGLIEGRRVRAGANSGRGGSLIHCFRERCGSAGGEVRISTVYRGDGMSSGG